MGGGGPGTTANLNTGGGSSAPVLQSGSPLDTFNGSRQAVVDQGMAVLNNKGVNGISGILQANPVYQQAWDAYTNYTNALAMNPTAPPVDASTIATPVGFNSDPYGGDGTGVAEAAAAASGDTSELPHLGADIVAAREAAAQAQAKADADAKAAADAAAAAKPQDPNRPGFYNGIELGTKTWPPGPEWDRRDVHEWLAANPHHDQAFEVPDKGPIGTPGNSWYLPKGVPL
jgi:hypothetical protein